MLAQQQIDFKHIEQVNMLQNWLNEQGKEQMKLSTEQNEMESRMKLVEEIVKCTSEEVHNKLVKISQENYQKITNFELRFQKIEKSMKSFDLRANSIQKLEAGLDDIQNRMIDTKLLTSFACTSMPILVHFQICEALSKVAPWSQKANLINFEKDKIKELKAYFDMVCNTSNAVKILNIRSKVYLTSFAESEKGILPFNYADDAKPNMKIDEAAIFGNLNFVKLNKKADQFEKEKNEFKDAFDQCMIDKDKSSYLVLKHKIDRLNFEQLIHLKDSLTQSFMKAHGQLSSFQPDVLKGGQQDASPIISHKKTSLNKSIDQSKITKQTSVNQTPSVTNPGSQRVSRQQIQGQMREDESAHMVRRMPEKIFIIKREDLRPYQRLDLKYQNLFQNYQLQISKLQNLAMGNFTKINLINLESSKEHEFVKKAIDELQKSLQEVENNSTCNLFKLEENLLQNQQKISKKLKFYEEKIDIYDEFNINTKQLLEELKQSANKNANILRDQIIMNSKEIHLTKISIEGIDKKIMKTQKEFSSQQKEFSDQIYKLMDKKIKDYFNSDIVQSQIAKNIQENLANLSVDLDDTKSVGQKTNVKKIRENEENEVVRRDSIELSSSIKQVNQKLDRFSRSVTIQLKDTKRLSNNQVISEQAKEESFSKESKDSEQDYTSSQNSPQKLPKKSLFQNKSVSSENQLSPEQKRALQAEKIKEKKEQERKKEEEIKAKQKAREQRIEIERKKREEEELERKEELKIEERRRLVQQELDEKQKIRNELNQNMRRQSKVIGMANKFMNGLSNQNDKMNNLQQKIGSQISSNNNYQTAKTFLQVSSPTESKRINKQKSELLTNQQNSNNIIKESNKSQEKSSNESDEDFINPFDFLKKQNEDSLLSPEKLNEIMKPQLDQIYQKIQSEVKQLSDIQNHNQSTNQLSIKSLEELTKNLKTSSTQNYNFLESSLSCLKKEMESFKSSLNLDFSQIQEQMITEKREIMKLRRNMKYDIENEVNKIKALDKENSQTFQFLKIKTQGLMECVGCILQDCMLGQMLSEQETIDRKQMVLTGFKKNCEILGTNQSAMSNNLGVVSPGRAGVDNFWKLRNKNAKYDDVILETRSVSQTVNDKINVLSQSVMSNDNELVNASFIDRYKSTSNYNTLFLDRTTQNQSVQLIQQIKLACLNYINTPIKYGPINFKRQQSKNNQLQPQINVDKNETDENNTQINNEVQNSKDQIQQIILKSDNLVKDSIYIELSHLEILSLKEILLLQANYNYSQLPVNVQDIFKVKEAPKFQKTTFQVRKKVQDFNIQKLKQLETKSLFVSKRINLQNSKQKQKKQTETQSTLQNDFNQSMEIKDLSRNNSQIENEQNTHQDDIFQLRSANDQSETQSDYHIQTEINSTKNGIPETANPKFDIPILKKLLKDKQNAISQYLKERPVGSHYSIPKNLIDSFVDDQIQKSLNEMRQQEIKRQEVKNIEQSLKIMKMTIGLQQRISSASKSNQPPKKSESLQDMLEDFAFDQVLNPKSPANDYHVKSKQFSGQISILKEPKKINIGVKIGSKAKQNQELNSKQKYQLNMTSDVIPNMAMLRIMTPNQTDSLQKRTRYDLHSFDSNQHKNMIVGRAKPKPNIPDLCFMSVTTNADKNIGLSSQNHNDYKSRQQVSQSVTLKIGELSGKGLDNRPCTRPEKMTRQMASNLIMK